MNTIIENPDKSIWNELTKRALVDQNDLTNIVTNILEEVKYNGDQALINFSEKFDKLKLNTLIDSREDKDLEISNTLKTAINRAKNNIEIFHKAQKRKNLELQTEAGVFCSVESRPIESVGLYIPGGTAPLFSSLLMLVIPAKIAGVKNIVICSPPNSNGKVNDVIRYVASILKIKNVYTIGGAQAIAAMSYGTETVPKVNKIFGPGNSFVNTAKKLIQASGEVAIDLPAGPTELLIIADKFANSDFIAADILSQIEHGKDSQVIILSTSKEILIESKNKVVQLIQKFDRSEITKEAIKNCKFILFKELDSAFNFSNLYAPEHLILAIKNALNYKNKILSAGSVFLGNYSAESFGDYASGTNHTLPTDGAARMYSGVNLDSFQKQITFQEISINGLRNLGPTVIELAKEEKLKGHSYAVEVRLHSIKDKLESVEEFKIERLIRSHLRNITPYSSARSEYSGNNSILLDANENSLGSLGSQTLNRYPSPKHLELREKLALINNLESKNVFIGNGSDEIIDLLIRVFCEPNRDSIAVLNPTFGMYETQCLINDINVIKLDLNSDFSLKQYSELERSDIKICFICNPNNPTANSYSLDEIENILKYFRGILVIDEAYIEFSKEESSQNLVSKYKNLVILRTFSKAYGLAGARIGYLFGSSEIVTILDTVKAPYNISLLNAEAALEALGNQGELEEKVNQILSNRDNLVRELSELKIVKEVFPSNANFLLVRVSDSKKVYEFLKENKVIVRRRDNLLHCDHCLRITVGTEDENERVVLLLKSFE